MTLPAPHPLDSVNLRAYFVPTSYAPWFDSRKVLDDTVIIPYVCGNHFHEDIPLFVLG